MICAVVLTRFTTGFYNVLMMKSGERSVYFWSMYFIDVGIHIISLTLYYAVVLGFGFRLAGFWLVCILFAFANPLFIYAVVLLCTLVLRKSSSYSYAVVIGPSIVFYFFISFSGTFFYLQNT